MSSKNYSVTLKDEKGRTIAGKTVTLTINGKNYNAVSGSDGVATFSLTKAMLKSAGNKDVTIKFAGDANYTASTATAKITVKKRSRKNTQGQKDIQIQKIQKDQKHKSYFEKQQKQSNKKG